MNGSLKFKKTERSVDFLSRGIYFILICYERPAACPCMNGDKLTFSILTLLNSVEPKPTPKGQASNAEVYRSAARLMVRKGYEATSISDIAQAVGMTKAGLYHHITGKQDLLFQILQHAWGEMERLVIEPAKQVQDPEDRLTQLIRRHVRGILGGGLEFTLLFEERHHLDEKQQGIMAQQTKSYLALVGGTLHALADEGKLRDLDIQIATIHLLKTISSIADWYPRFSEINEEHLIEQTVNFGLSAILKR